MLVSCLMKESNRINLIDSDHIPGYFHFFSLTSNFSKWLCAPSLKLSVGVTLKFKGPNNLNTVTSSLAPRALFVEYGFFVTTSASKSIQLGPKAIIANIY